MSRTGQGMPEQSATADRETVVSQIIDAPRELVFEAFTDVRHLPHWWGPEGFTTTARDPRVLPGGTTFHFVNDGIESALEQAREAAGDRDVRVAGGGATIVEYVNAGLIDEFSIALSPVLFGSGIRLFEGVDAARVALEQVRAEPSPRVTHLTYTVRER
ncbi:dihydrofolate reductase family protein [Streptomyces anulatus]|uniref:Dihydrofolate reductase family protein n=1 Tax=Streptomyces anulatus TaxID=1892 RepID=A0ABZ1ZD33_STRAQ|nr:dihydrofolate reductase family protein [Streptomyces anulatus]MCX4521972.1 dihydrofolate reductase family protein [Streptomyces anulatus]MCX4604848.1 dihydrofolate reductase family protein [Streptomyces anulatus]WTE29671.1 dihydrofolate reductase family protein [Streptomyces anulatus]